MGVPGVSEHSSPEPGSLHEVGDQISGPRTEGDPPSQTSHVGVFPKLSPSQPGHASGPHRIVHPAQAAPLRGQGTDYQLRLIEDFSKFSRQKSGGFFEPIISRSSLYCSFCADGSTCLGSYCLGSKPYSLGSKPSLERAPSPPKFPRKTLCPGLVGDTVLTTLTELRFDQTQKQKVATATLSCGELYGWRKDKSGKSSPTSTSSRLSSASCRLSKASPRTRHPKPLKSFECSTNVYDRRALQALLRNCGVKSKQSRSRYAPPKTKATLSSTLQQKSNVVQAVPSPAMKKKVMQAVPSPVKVMHTVVRQVNKVPATAEKVLKTAQNTEKVQMPPSTNKFKCVECDKVLGHGVGDEDSVLEHWTKHHPQLPLLGATVLRLSDGLMVGLRYLYQYIYQCGAPDCQHITVSNQGEVRAVKEIKDHWAKKHDRASEAVFRPLSHLGYICHVQGCNTLLKSREDLPQHHSTHQEVLPRDMAVRDLETQQVLSVWDIFSRVKECPANCGAIFYSNSDEDTVTRGVEDHCDVDTSHLFDHCLHHCWCDHHKHSSVNQEIRNRLCDQPWYVCQIEMCEHSIPGNSVDKEHIDSMPSTSDQIPAPEILRSSSPRRAESASRSSTPRRTRSKGHTPRKDTPKKKGQKIQCRNQGCRVWFTTESARIRHEAYSCNFIPGDNDDISLECEEPLPVHDISPLQCRFPGCQKQYSQEAHRKRHEIEKHRMLDRRGRTVSPACYPPPPPPPSTSRPQSCPPPLSTFLTPDRPSKRRRITPASSTSSLLDSPTSPLSSPNLTITPQSSDFSSSETDSETPDESENVKNECKSCLVLFKNKKNLNRHRCSFKYNHLLCRQNNITPLILCPPHSVSETMSILSQLCVEDQTTLCRLQSWCLPNIYPLCFPYNQRSGRLGTVPLLQTFTSFTNSTDVLKKMVEKEGEFKLPKHILIIDKERAVTAYLPIEILTPPSTFFTVVETSDSFLVSKANNDNVDDDMLEERFSDESDCSNAMDSDDDLELPTPPYVPYSSVSQDHPCPIQERNRGATCGGGDGGGGGDSDSSESEDGFNGDDNPSNPGDDGNGGDDDGGGDDDDGGDDDEDETDDDDTGDRNDDGSGDGRDDNNNQIGDQVPRELRDLLPDDFLPGVDGLGARFLQQRQAASYFRKPWFFLDETIQHLVRLTKRQFFDLVLSSVGARERRSSSDLNIFAETFLFLLKLCHQLSFQVISELFALKNKCISSDVFYRYLVHHYRTCCNIPSVICNGIVNDLELNKLLHDAYQRTPLFFRTLLAKFEDPTGNERLPVCLNIDATYFDIQSSEDIELQKHIYYPPRACHTVKLLSFTDLSSKFVGLLPVASSQSPASGDGLLLSKHIELEEGSENSRYVRSILGGNGRYFVILVTDAGFVCVVPNAPTQAHGPSLAEVCRQEGAVLLHTSTKYEKYHLHLTPRGKIRKVPWSADRVTLDENVVKFTRLIRKIQEQVHAGLKGRFSILDMRHLWNSCLLPFTSSQLTRYNLAPALYKNTPRLNLIATVCCSLFNSSHPGFQPIYMSPTEQVRSATSLLTRLFLENPLMYPDIWPISLDGPRRDSAWVEVSFRDLEDNDVLQFPKLNAENINPIALEIISGPHALVKADSTLTYMNQLLIKDLNLTREETVQRLQAFPSDWKVQFLDITTPGDFQPSELSPQYCPPWWNSTLFGPWQDLRLVRCQIPPSYKSATTRANFHWAVIGFGRAPGNRLGLRSPYDQIYFFRCFKCPAKNGMMSMDRHLAAFLKALSFPEEYRSTAKTVNILNTVANTRRQTTDILPPTPSTDLPSDIRRRSRNVRANCPIYNLNSPDRHVIDNSDSSMRLSDTHASDNDSVPANTHHSDQNLDNTATSDFLLPTSPRPTISSENDMFPTPSVSITSPPPPYSLVSDIAAAGVNSRETSTAGQGRDRTRQSGRSRVRSTGPAALYDRHVATLDPTAVHSIPQASQNQQSSEIFNISHLQTPGLLNDGNYCSIISFLQSLHRINIKEHLIDPHFCVTEANVPDYPALILHRMLSAMPSSAPFSPHLLIESWNRSGRQPSIQPGFIDLPTVIEALISHMQLKRYSTHSVLTRYLASFTCPACGKVHDRVSRWEGQYAPYVPVLSLPDNNQVVNIPDKIAEYLDQPINTRCTDQNCRHVISNGKFFTDLGLFTIISVCRFDIDNPNKKLNRLDMSVNNPELSGNNLLGDLVSCICHRGDVDHGHFVTYHKVGRDWYLTDDSRPPHRSENPFEQTRYNTETVEALFFINNV